MTKYQRKKQLCGSSVQQPGKDAHFRLVKSRQGGQNITFIHSVLSPLDLLREVRGGEDACPSDSGGPLLDYQYYKGKIDN